MNGQWCDYDLSNRAEGVPINVEIRKDSLNGVVVAYTLGVIRNGKIVANVKTLATLAGATIVSESDMGIVINCQGTGYNDETYIALENWSYASLADLLQKDYNLATSLIPVDTDLVSYGLFPLNWTRLS